MRETIGVKRADGMKGGFAGGREFVQAVAQAASREELKKVLAEGGVTDYDEEQFEESYRNLALSQDWDAVLALFNDKDFESCQKRLAVYGIEPAREEFDLINELIASALDRELVEELRTKKEIDAVMELFHAHGFHAITGDFLMLVRENATHIYEDALLTPEDIEALSGRDFYERCRKSVNLVFALSTIAGLAMGVSGVSEPAFLLAIASGISLMFPAAEDGQERRA